MGRPFYWLASSASRAPWPFSPPILGSVPSRRCPSGGSMLKDAQSSLALNLSFGLFPGAIALTVRGLNLLGDGLRDLLDPKSGWDGGSRQVDFCNMLSLPYRWS